MLPEDEPSVALSVGEMLLWCAALAFIGVFLAVPLRRQVLLKEKLVYPSGTASHVVSPAMCTSPVTMARQNVLCTDIEPSSPPTSSVCASLAALSYRRPFPSSTHHDRFHFPVAARSIVSQPLR